MLLLRSIKPKTEKVRYGDEHGLYPEVSPAGEEIMEI
jgi:hypothetical protein